MNFAITDPALVAVFPMFALVVGLCMGSFYNVCALRYVSGESVVTPPSHCPKCGHKLSWWENIPILSYLLLRGQCRSCKASIGIRYMLVEFFSAGWAWAVANQVGPSVAWLFLMTIGGICIVLSLIDFDTYLLPDILTYPGAIIAIPGSIYIMGMPWEDVLLGVAVGAGFFWVLQKAYKLLRGVDGLGTGDIKLMLMLGAVCGLKDLPVMILAASISGLLAGVIYMRANKDKKMQTMIPFGPFLCAGAMGTVLFADIYWNYVLGR